MFVVTALLLALVAPLVAQDGDAGASIIVATGEGVLQRPPDVAFVTLELESNAENPREAQRQNTDLLAAIRRRLTVSRVPQDALKITGLVLQQEFENVGGRQVPRRNRYVARTTIEIRVDDVARAGDIAEAMMQAGASSLKGVRFDLQDRAAVEREALRLAVESAYARASAAAAGASKTLDRIVRIEESPSEAVIARPTVLVRVEGVPIGNVEPGVLEIRAHVTLTAAVR
jgi:uncharacterized protein YggE